MRAKCTGGRCITTKEAAILLSIVLECRLVPREDAPKNLSKLLRELPLLFVLPVLIILLFDYNFHQIFGSNKYYTSQQIFKF